MPRESLFLQETCGALLISAPDMPETGDIHGVFHLQCVGADGVEKWSEHSANLIVNQGKNALLDNGLAGSAFTAAYYLSLITAGSAISTSTYAVPTVTEVTTGVLAARQALTWTAASVGAKASNTAVCAIIGSATITGAMVVSGGTGVTTPGNTAAAGGVLFSASNFQGGSKAVSNGDTLNVSYSVSL